MPAPQRGALIVLYTQTGIVQLLEYSCEIANLSTGILILLPAQYLPHCQGAGMSHDLQKHLSCAACAKKQRFAVALITGAIVSK